MSDDQRLTHHRGSLARVLPDYKRLATAAVARMELPPSQRAAFDDELCERCGGFAPFGHKCCTCDDAGRVRLALPAGHSQFGRPVLCPDCVPGAQPAGTPNAPQVSLEEFQRRARIPMTLRGATISNWDPRHQGGNARPQSAVRGWCATWPPPKATLLLMGNVGNGKTHMAVGVLRDVWERHHVVGVLWNVVDLLERYKATFDRASGGDQERATETTGEIDAQLLRLPLLVLDDFGAQQDTEWSRRVLYQLVNRHYESGRPLIVTSNQGVADDRTISRLADAERTVIVQFNGADVRLKVRTG